MFTPLRRRNALLVVERWYSHRSRHRPDSAWHRPSLGVVIVAKPWPASLTPSPQPSEPWKMGRLPLPTPCTIQPMFAEMIHIQPSVRQLGPTPAKAARIYTDAAERESRLRPLTAQERFQGGRRSRRHRCARIRRIGGRVRGVPCLRGARGVEGQSDRRRSHAAAASAATSAASLK